MTKFSLPLIALAFLLMGAGCTSPSNFFLDGDTATDSTFETYDEYEDDYSYVEEELEEDDYVMPDGLQSKVDAPLRATVGERFEVIATVTNNTTQDQFLHSIDVSEAYLDGVAIVSTTPEYSQSFSLDDGTMTHYFKETVPAGQTYAVTFELEALTAGDHGGAFDVCFHEGLDCSYLQIRTIVE